MSLVCFAKTQVIIGTNDVICSMQYHHTKIYVVLYFLEKINLHKFIVLKPFCNNFREEQPQKLLPWTIDSKSLILAGLLNSGS